MWYDPSVAFAAGIHTCTGGCNGVLGTGTCRFQAADSFENTGCQPILGGFNSAVLTIAYGSG